MAEVLSWLVTVVVVLAAVTFVLHVASIWRQPLERPRVLRRDRFGEPIGDDENPGPEIQGDEDDEDAGDEAGDEAGDDASGGEADARHAGERGRRRLREAGAAAGSPRRRGAVADRARPAP